MERYELIRSNRKTVAIQIKADGRVVVRAPMHMARVNIDDFVASKADWIGRHLASMQRRRADAAPALSEEQLRVMAKAALADILPRVKEYAALVGVAYGRVTIRAQKTRWGSCSAKGNLNFNCLLMLCPEEIRDYVVVHELCHRKELNHSARFWNEVARVMPDYACRRKWLKENGGAIIQRLRKA